MSSKNIEFALGSLRHLYANMINSSDLDTARMAVGILGPAIKQIAFANRPKPVPNVCGICLRIGGCEHVKGNQT